MSNLPRRTLEDLSIRYELEPSLRDIYVEGNFDKDVLTACFENTKESERVIYVIDTVEVPYDILKKHGLTEGNKQRVIATAKELSSTAESQCQFLADKDIDHWFEELQQVKGLIWTKYCSIELYFLVDAYLRKILINAAGIKVANWEAFVSSFYKTLLFLYSMRLADRELNLCLEWIELDRELYLDKGMININEYKYIEKILNKNKKMPLLESFTRCQQRWLENCVAGDQRLAIRGHDFVKALAWVIKNGKGKTALGTEKAVEGALILLASSELELHAEFAES